MQWPEIRQAYPNRWLIVEALKPIQHLTNSDTLTVSPLLKRVLMALLPCKDIALSINNTLYGSSTLYIPAARNSIFAHVNG